MISRPRHHLLWLSAALGAAVIADASPVFAQLAKADEQKAAEAAEQAGPSQLRVLLVVSSTTQDYKYVFFLTRVAVGRLLREHTEKALGQSFAAVKVLDALPTDAQGFAGYNLAVLLESPHCEVHGQGFHNVMTMTAEFAVRTARGDEIFRVREEAHENNNNLYHGGERLSEAVATQFVREMLANASVKNFLLPSAPATKPAPEDTAAMDSSGLDVPPPPPWPMPAPAADSAPAGSGSNGRP